MMRHELAQIPPKEFVEIRGICVFVKCTFAISLQIFVSEINSKKPQFLLLCFQNHPLTPRPCS